jgi:hypothetical protein
MNSIRNLSDIELRAAIASELTPQRWINIRVDDRGRLLADSIRMFSEFPIELPNWSSNAADAAWLEGQIKKNGLGNSYIEILRDEIGIATQASPRQKSEAALMALRGAACPA